MTFKKKTPLKTAKDLGIDEDLYNVLRSKKDIVSIIKLLEESDLDFSGLLDTEDKIKDVAAISNEVTQFFENLSENRKDQKIGKEIKVEGQVIKLGFSAKGLDIKLIEMRIAEQKAKQEEVGK